MNLEKLARSKGVYESTHKRALDFYTMQLFGARKEKLNYS
jgi:hypothetical protein